MCTKSIRGSDRREKKWERCHFSQGAWSFRAIRYVSEAPTDIEVILGSLPNTPSAAGTPHTFLPPHASPSHYQNHIRPLCPFKSFFDRRKFSLVGLHPRHIRIPNYPASPSLWVLYSPRSPGPNSANVPLLALNHPISTKYC